MTKFCMACGFEVAENDSFCALCGTPVERADAASSPRLHDDEAGEDTSKTIVFGGEFDAVALDDGGDEEDATPTVVLYEPQYWLVRMRSGERTEIDLPCVIGRGSSANYRITGNPAVSRTHAKLSLEGDAVLLQDLTSTNSTYLDGTALEASSPRPVKNGALITLADEEVKFICE